MIGREGISARSMARRSLAVMLGATFVAWCFAAPPARAAGGTPPDIWLAGVDPVVWHRQKHAEPNDFMSMFDPAAPWQQAASHVKVFQVEPDFVIYGQPEVVSRMTGDLKRRNIGFAVTMGMLYGDLKCGKGMEGYLSPAAPVELATRLKKIGAELQYVVMDEPLFFGHRDNPGGCKFPIAEVARQVAKHVAEMRKIFPGLKVGDSEPIGQRNPADWVDEIMQWMDAYQAAVGEPLALIHLDIAWQSPLWRDHLKKLDTFARSKGTKVAIIYNGAGKSGPEWTHTAEQRYIDIESNMKIIPDIAVIQTWEPQPERMMPDTEAGTLTNLAARYAQWEQRRR